MNSWHIHSTELKEGLNSFGLDIQEDRHWKSFVHSLLTKRSIEQLVTYIRSLSNGIEFTKDPYDADPSKVIVYEVDVTSEKDKLTVTKQEFFENTLDLSHDRVKVIIVHSDSLNVVDAKLAVYREYASKIDLKKTYIHHSFDEFDDIFKFCAGRKLSSYYDRVKSLRRSLERDAHHEVVTEAFSICVTREKVREICFEEDIHGIALGSGPYKCRWQYNVKSLKQDLVDKTLRKISKSLGSEIAKGIYQNISNAIKRTLEAEFMDLQRRLSIDVFPHIALTFAAFLIEIFQGISDIIVAIREYLVTIIFPVDINTREWRRQVADDIFEQVSKNCPKVIDKMVDNMLSMFDPTVTDLKNMKKKIKTTIRLLDLPTDQQHIVKLWQKKDEIDKARLKTHPSFLQCIAGFDSDENSVITFFFRDDNEDEKFQSFCKGCCKVSNDTKFDFVSVAVKAPRKITEDDQIAIEEKKAPAINTLDIKRLEEVIDEQGDKIYARYSNVIGIGISRVRCEGNIILKEPCIVLYCLAKDITPFGESKLPKFIEGYPCNTRDDFVMFGKGNCPHDCPASNKRLPEPGCCIGITHSYGSVGFLVEFGNNLTCGFLTASHVVVQGFKDIYRANISLPNQGSSRNQEPVVHISNSTPGQTNVGEVVEAFFGNYESKEGVDLALVKSEMLRQGDKEILSVVKDRDLNFEENLKVRKTGKATGTTDGYLTHNIRSVKVDELIFKNCFAVKDLDNNVTKFFESGDSGSGVFLIRNETMQPLGIAFAFMNNYTLVCRIDKFLDHLNLAIVQYRLGN